MVSTGLEPALVLSVPSPFHVPGWGIGFPLRGSVSCLYNEKASAL